MKPSSLRTWAMLRFSSVAGISTAARSMRLALRMRVSMSAIGSVIMALTPLPTRFLYARNETIAGQAAKTDPADAELPIDGPAPAAQLAAIADADFVARPQLGFIRLPL